MYKFAPILVALLAFQAVSGRALYDQEQRIQVSQQLLGQIRSLSNDSSGSVQNLQIDSPHGQRVLVSEAAELSHHIHEVVYQLHQIIQHNHDGQGEQVLQQVVSSLSDIVHSIEESLHQQPSQLQSQLRSQIQNVVAQAEHLDSVIQQQQQSEAVNIELLIVLDDLVVAVHQVLVRNRLEGQNQQQVVSQIQAVVNEVSSAVQNINSNDANVAHILIHHSHHLVHHLDEIIHILHREIHHQQGEVQNVLRQVLGSLLENLVSLQQIPIDSPVSNVVSQIRIIIGNIGSQIERLVPLVASENVNEQGRASLRDAVERILAHGLVGGRQLQRNVAVLVQNNQEN